MSPAEEYDELIRVPTMLLCWLGVPLVPTSVGARAMAMRYYTAVVTVVTLVLACSLWLAKYFAWMGAYDTFLKATEVIPKLIVCSTTVMKLMFMRSNMHKARDILVRLQALFVEQYGDLAADEESSRGAESDKYLLRMTVKILINIQKLTLVVFVCSSLFMTISSSIKEGRLHMFLPVMMSYWWLDYEQPQAWPLMFVHTLTVVFTIAVAEMGIHTLIFAYCTLISLACRGVSSRLRAGGCACLRQTIIQHQKTVDLVQQIDDITSKITLIIYGASTLTICFIGLALLVVKERLTFFLLLIISFAKFLLFSYFCNKVTESSEDVAVAVYETMWYAAEVEKARSILILLYRAQCPFYLTAYKFRNIGLSSFTEMLSNAWSYFAVLRTVYGSD